MRMCNGCFNNVVQSTTSMQSILLLGGLGHAPQKFLKIRYSEIDFGSTVQPRGNVALARIFLSSGEFDSIVSQVHLLFYNTNSEKLQWIYARRPCHSTS